MKEQSYGIIPFLIEKNGVYILLYRTSYKTNEYQFLKGKPNFKESIKETVLREIKEEISLNLDIEDLNDKNFIFHTNLKKDIGLYIVNFDKYMNKSITLENGIYEIKWFRVNKLPKIVKNQELFLTDILIKFEYLNFNLGE